MKQYFGPNQVSKKSALKSYGVVLLIVLSFFGGAFWAQGRQFQSAGSAAQPNVLHKGLVGNVDNPDVDFQIFWDTWDDIKQSYVNQPVSDIDLFYGAMRGLVSSVGDPHSSYFDPATAKSFNDALSGSFAGIGVEVGIKNQQLVVISPLEGTPGAKAGLKPGDSIVAINDLDTSNMTLDTAVNLIRGEAGTVVHLTIVPKDSNQAKVVDIERAVINHIGFRWELLNGHIAHIKLSSFDQDSENQLNEFIRQMPEKNVDQIILDLRGNPGGLLDMAIEVASEWVEDGVVVKEQDNSQTVREHHARGRARLANIPTVVLINEGSASASEIVAGALKDYNIAPLIGETTFGKGSVQKYEVLEDGSGYKLTIAKWFTPNNNAIDGVGVVPDMEVDRTQDDFDQDRDPQLDAAIQTLKDR